MKLGKFVLSALAVASLLAGCKEKEENLGAPSLTLDVKELTFDTAADSKAVTFTATRDWNAKSDAGWIVVVPESGNASSEPQTVTVSVLENKELDRSAKVEFSIGMSSSSLTVSQKGEKGSAEDFIVYFNDFDREQAKENEEGKWPFLDQTEIWKNEKGTGASAVDYASSGVSVRSNSTSDSKYSDYAGSGMNNLLFSSNNNFQIKGIALGSETDYKISFGTERYAYEEDDNTFVNSEFHIYISNDAQKWVELEYAFPNGPKNGRWDLASSVFTLPSGTSQLNIYVKSDLSGAHRLDDLKLEVSSESGTQIDFSKGVDLGTGGGLVETIADVHNAANGTSADLKDLLVVAIYARGYMATDGKDNLLVYANADGGVKIGDKVNVSGEVAEFGGLKQLASPKTEVLSSDNAVEYPEAKDINAAFDSYDAKTNEFITYSGMLTIDGKGYCNVAVPGASVNVGSISYPHESLGIDSFNGQNIVVKGYYLGKTGGKYIGVMALSIERADSGPFLSVTPSVIDVEYDATSATINVGSNVAWTAESSNPDFVLDKTSGSGSGEIKVTFSANEGETARTADITVSTSEDVAVKSYVVKITQKVEPAPIEQPLTSNVKWTGSDTNDSPDKAYNHKVIVNGSEYEALKLGTSKAVGKSTLTIPSGTTKVGFYGVSWSGKSGAIEVKLGEQVVFSTDLVPNDGASDQPPYTLTITSENYYEMTLPSALAEDTEVVVSTVSGKYRAILFGINAYK